jgi:hypothetical protein
LLAAIANPLHHPSSADMNLSTFNIIAVLTVVFACQMGTQASKLHAPQTKGEKAGARDGEKIDRSVTAKELVNVGFLIFKPTKSQFALEDFEYLLKVAWTRVVKVR